MSKLYFNAVAGNRYEGYPVKYINDAGKEFDLVWTPKSDFGYYSSSLRKRCLCDASPYKLMNNTVHTPSAWFDFAPDMSFFDPMSVNYLQETVNRIYLVGTQTSYMAAFPPRYNGFVAHNHVIDNNDYYFYPQTGNNSMGNADYFGEPAVLQNSSVVEDDLKKELFTYSYSCNIEEMEEQFQMDWESICNDSSLSAISWCRFPVTSNKDIDHTRKMSLSVFSRGAEHTLPSGFQHYFESYNVDYDKYTVKDNKSLASIEDTLFFADESGLYNTRPEDNLIVNREFSEGFPLSLLFVEEIYLLQKIGGGTDVFTYIIPIRNENDDNDYYFQVISYNSTSLHASPENTDIYFAYMGNIRIQKDKLKNKWIMSFSSPSLMAKTNYFKTNQQIGYFEGDGNIDPLNSSDGLELTYVDGLGNKSDSPYFKLIKFSDYYSRKGVELPIIYGDSRWKDTWWSEQAFGVGLKLKAELYRDDLFKEQTYISVDSGSYTFAI